MIFPPRCWFVGLCLVLLSATQIAAAKNPPTPTPGQGETWWSLAPLSRPCPPATADPKFASWASNPIDRFVLAKLREKGLEPSPPADKWTWLRRVSYDLTGLPPTWEEINRFLADASSDAFVKAADRLLASPHYGERWARHWMDVVHYAETHGHDQDRPRPNAWPYRDFLIRSFNSDKPYARFVREQLAGDVLYPGDADAVIALGFLATGPWDESSLRDIREDTLDREIARYLDRDDMVTTAASTFLSTTVHCARCHDHKFDPISQNDYYSLQAVFAGVDKADRAYDADPKTAAMRKALLARITRLDALQGTADPSLLAPDTEAAVAAWEKGLKAKVVLWQPLDPVQCSSSGGATLVKRPDGSVLATGKRPEVDTYTIVAHTELHGVTGIRLEVLTDPSLPHQGPGRQDNGNLHLNEITVRAGPKTAAGQEKPVALEHPAADYNQDGWTIAMALDGDPKTAWGVYPKVGQPHRAVFETREPVGFPGGATWTFVLQQTHGGGHLIGRARLSVTTAPRPLATAEDLPDPIAAIVAVPVGKRESKQKAELARFVLRERAERELAALPPEQYVYAAAYDFKPDGTFRPAGAPRPVHVLRRGEITKPGPEAAPGALSCLPVLEGRFRLPDSKNEGARRAALAAWVTDLRNPLTWRSIVNRVWHYHFGRGLVDTPNDFGRMGSRPTHPELLDWLAGYFQETGGSLKALHRLIVTSATYRQSSGHNPRFTEVDGDNRYLWRMSRTRLDAESVRDAVLVAAGKLDPTMGGPSVKQFIQTPGVHVTPNVDYQNFDADRPENFRRSVYRFVFRTLPDPFMEVLDCPDSSQWTPARTLSLSPLQALAMLNDKFMVRMSEHLAARAAGVSRDLAAQVRAVYEWTLGREPTPAELKKVGRYTGTHGVANACRVLLNSNEFMFVN